MTRHGVWGLEEKHRINYYIDIRRNRNVADALKAGGQNAVGFVMVLSPLNSFQVVIKLRFLHSLCDYDNANFALSVFS